MEPWLLIAVYPMLVQMLVQIQVNTRKACKCWHLINLNLSNIDCYFVDYVVFYIGSKKVQYTSALGETLFSLFEFLPYADDSLLFSHLSSLLFPFLFPLVPLLRPSESIRMRGMVRRWVNNVWTTPRGSLKHTHTQENIFSLLHTDAHTSIWRVCLWSSLSINHTLIPKVPWSPLATEVDAR